MSKKTILIAFSAILSLGLFSQRPTLELTFTSFNNAAYVQLDSIKIMNRTQGGETMIYWPDTVLSLEFNAGDLLLYVGYATFSTAGVSEVIDDISSFTVYQNYPNPMRDRSEISMNIPHTGNVHLMITDLQGKVMLRTDRHLNEGRHSFMFHPGDGNLFFLTTHWNGISRSIQMISMGQPDGKSCRYSCDKYGGLYQWDEMMQYTTQQGAQGICPPGWHLPTDEEWKVLEGAVDSQYGIGDPEWDIDSPYRGYNAGTNLKSTSGWYDNGNGTDLFGFSGLPGGYRFNYSYFDDVGGYGYWWTSSEDSNVDAWLRFLSFTSLGIFRVRGYKEGGFSVRCLRDY